MRLVRFLPTTCDQKYRLSLIEFPAIFYRAGLGALFSGCAKCRVI